MSQNYNLDRANTYIPFGYGDEVIRDGKRRFIANQGVRLDALIPEVTGKTILDVGTNTGWILFELLKAGGLSGVGIDNDEKVLALAKYIKREYGVDKAEFFLTDYTDYEPDLHFDVCLVLSIWPLHLLQPHLVRMVDWADTFIVEGTNHPRPDPIAGTPVFMDKEMLLKEAERHLAPHWDVTHLCWTDYQNRGMFKLTKKEKS